MPVKWGVQGSLPRDTYLFTVCTIDLEVVREPRRCLGEERIVGAKAQRQEDCPGPHVVGAE